jgi:FkbM family methyltransferase
VRSPGRIVNAILGLFGLRLYRTHTGGTLPLDFDAVFGRLCERGSPVGSVIDVGASNGCWSEKLRRYYPSARYHLIEANRYHEAGLKAFVRRFPDSSYVLAAAADSVGEIFFDDADAWGGTAAHEATESARNKVPCTTVDEEVSANALPGPYLLKLDTHGFEVPILEGARRTLRETSVIVMETYNFNLTDQSLTFWEMCGHLHELGFRPMDLLEPMHRPGDGAFWQVDIIFLRNDRPEFDDNRYA